MQVEGAPTYYLRFNEEAGECQQGFRTAFAYLNQAISTYLGTKEKDPATNMQFNETDTPPIDHKNTA